MSYQIYTPESRRNEKPGLMVTLHGCLQKGEDLRAAGNWEAAAEESNLVVVAPNAPNGGVILGCWDYYGTDHTESNRHNGPLIRLTEALVASSQLNIDRARVFVSGLSSGGGEAFVVGCLRPDLFAGVGLSSSPILGSTSNELKNPSITGPEAARLCRRFAGTRAGHLASQVASIIADPRDSIVASVHYERSTAALAEVYGAAENERFELADLDGPNKSGVGLYKKDAEGHRRVSLILNNGLGHAWPAGAEVTGGAWWVKASPYISNNSVNYPKYLAKFLTETALR